MKSGAWRWWGISALLCSACGSPAAPTPHANRAPLLTSVTASPNFGIQDLQTFGFSAVATDEDGDTLTYTWTISGVTLTGPTATGTFQSGGMGSAGVVVTDGHGGSASGAVSFIVGSMTGRWTITTAGSLNGTTLDLTQNATGGISGGATGTITVSGAVTLQLPAGIFTGAMATDGRTVTGTLQGQPFSMSK